jgi:hypothetical protein
LPQRHCFAAVAWDDATTTKAQAAYRLGLATGEELADRDKLPRCALCGAEDFQIEDGKTRFTTMAEALPALAAAQEAQARTRELFKVQRN